MARSNVQVGGRELIDSGTVIAYNDEDIELTLSPDKGSGPDDLDDLTFVFSFLEEDDGETDIDVTLIDDTKAELTILNQRNGPIFGGSSQQLGTNNPIQLGTFDDRELLFSYLVSAIYNDGEPETTKFIYNVYLGDEVQEEDNE